MKNHIKSITLLLLFFTLNAYANGEENLRRVQIGVLEKIKLPTMKMEGRPFKEAIAILQQEALNVDPEGKGVNIVIHTAVGYNLPDITLSLRSPTVGEVIAAIQSQTDLTVLWQNDAVIFQQTEDWKAERMKEVVENKQK